MNIDNLIERLKECGTYGFKRGICQEAAEALCEIQIELQAMRGAANLQGRAGKGKGRKGPADSTNQRRVLDLHQAI